LNATSHKDVTALVLAAGQGTRMNSDLPKVLHPMAGTPLLGHVLSTLDQLGVGRTLVVIGHQRERVRSAFPDAPVRWVTQEPQRGTGHAVMMAEPELKGFAGTLLVVCGDTPLLRAGTLSQLLGGHAATGASVTVLSMRLPDPTGYGRILREGPIVPGVPARILGIVEHRDASAEQRAIDEVNSGIYAFSYPRLAEVLARLTSHNAQGEYYLTDTVSLLRGAGQPTSVVCCSDHRELLGINTVDQLAEAERVFRELPASESERRS
jgi:bifunctional UDP-N-acetylglucosamine pyrophosphorylase/glucosamine-1-phosphate N-acetyltransferase